MTLQILYNREVKIKGLVPALEVTAYCSAIGFLMFRENEIFGKVPNFFGPVAFLLLFSFSALICGLIVFYKPYLLFFSKRQKEAIDLVVYTAAWLFLFFMIFLGLSVVLK